MNRIRRLPKDEKEGAVFILPDRSLSGNHRRWFIAVGTPRRKVEPDESMTNSQRLTAVRRCLAAWLSEHSPGRAPTMGTDRLPCFNESILIREGFYRGRRFEAGDHDAVWFVEEDVLKIYDSLGDLKCVMSGDEIARRSRPEELPAGRRAA